MKVKITDPRGLRVGDETVPVGTEVELDGPILDAALRFKQAEEVKAEKKPEAKK